MNILKFFFFGLLISFSTISFSDCDLRLKVNPIIYQGIHNTSIQEQFIEVSRKFYLDKPNCHNYFITFSKGRSTSYNRFAKDNKNKDYIPYNLFKSSNGTNVLKDYKDIVSANEVLEGQLNLNEVKHIPFYFNLISENFLELSSGVYKDEVRVHLYSGSVFGKNHCEDSKEVHIQIINPKVLEISILNEGEKHDPHKNTKLINFGELIKGKEKKFEVSVLTNSAFTLRAMSLNNGFLKHTSSSNKNLGLVPYEFYMNNNLIKLNNSERSEVELFNSEFSQKLKNYYFNSKIVIGNVSDRNLEGNYQDAITLTVIAK